MSGRRQTKSCVRRCCVAVVDFVVSPGGPDLERAGIGLDAGRYRLRDDANEFYRVFNGAELFQGVRYGEDLVLLLGFIWRSEVDFNAAQQAAADQLG